jgi:hypothetical protein
MQSVFKTFAKMSNVIGACANTENDNDDSSDREVEDEVVEIEEYGSENEETSLSNIIAYVFCGGKRESQL